MVNSPVPPKNPKSDPLRRLPHVAVSSLEIPVEEEDPNDVPTRVRHAGPDATPPPPVVAPPAPLRAPPPPPRPPRRTTIPPPLPPAAMLPPTPPPALPESPFDIPPTPGPIAAEEFPPTPPPYTIPQPYGAPASHGAPAPYPPGPPPGLPRPGGYLAPGGFNAGVHAPAAPVGRPPSYATSTGSYDLNAGFSNNGFNLAPPDTIDFGADTVPVVERRSGPPGLVILIVLLGAAIGGAKLGQLATRGDLTKLEAAAADGQREVGVVPTVARPTPDRK